MTEIDKPKERESNKRVFPWAWLIALVLCGFGLFSPIYFMRWADGRQQVHAQQVVQAAQKKAENDARDQACRDKWAGKDKLPALGGGWVNVSKLPQGSFRVAQVGDECGFSGFSRDLYWDGEKIRFDNLEKWPIFSVSAGIENKRRKMNCEKQGMAFRFTSCIDRHDAFPAP